MPVLRLPLSLSCLMAAALALPNPAAACSFAPQFVSGLPAGDAPVPTNAQAFALAPFMGRTQMYAELYDPRAFAPIPVDVRSLGADIVQLDLPPLDPSINYTARVWMDDLDDEFFDFSFVPGRSADNEAPPAPAVTWGGHEGPADSCETSGWYIDVQVQRVADPDVILYELVEVMPNDAIVAVGAIFVSDEASPTQIVSAAVGRLPLNDRCFSVRSVDLAGNRSFEQDVHCFTPIPLPIDGGMPNFDGGVPNFDAGPATDAGEATQDAGEPAPDAGQSLPDAGQSAETSGGLNTQDAGCGCSSFGTSGAAAEGTLGFFVIGLGALWRRRRAPHR